MEFTKAIVCKVLDYKDSSKILYLYTDKGNISVIARGVKKLNSLSRNLSQVGNYIRFINSKTKLPSLKEGELINDFPNVKLDLEAYAFVSHILELINATVDEHNDHIKMFDFLVRILNLFNQELDPEILSFIFELKLLYFLGYGINFKKSEDCDESEMVYSISDGGLICRSQITPNRGFYEEDIYNVIKYLYYVDINTYKEFDLPQNERIMVRHIIDTTYEEFIGYHSKSRSILKQIKKY